MKWILTIQLTIFKEEEPKQMTENAEEDFREKYEKLHTNFLSFIKIY